MEQRHRYDAKLAMILRESSAVFAEKGYDRAGVRDISSATGVSLSGLYYYFESKEELLFLIQRHCFDTLLERLAQDLDESDGPDERLAIIVRNHLRFFVDNMAEMKVLSHEADALTGDYLKQITERKKQYVGAVRSCVDEMEPARDERDRRAATFSLFGMMNWIYTWYRPGRDVSVDRLASTILHIFLRGAGYPNPADGAPATLKGDDRKTSMWEES